MTTVYNRIGKGYSTTRKSDPYLAERLFQLMNPKAKGKYLDVGCGTGNYTHALYQKGVTIQGIDPSDEMLNQARKINPKINFQKGHSENIPFENNSFDGVVVTLSIHHWTDLKKGFTEICRVLKPNGTFVLFHSLPIQMDGYWLNAYFPKMMEGSKEKMQTFEELNESLSKANLKIVDIENYSVQPDLQDQFLYIGKFNPELYFDEKIRFGISSFSQIANQQEVNKGLLKLRTDIDSGKIESIIKSYKNDLGDYVFYKIRKSPSS